MQYLIQEPKDVYVKLNLQVVPYGQPCTLLLVRHCHPSGFADQYSQSWGLTHSTQVQIHHSFCTGAWIICSHLLWVPFLKVCLTQSAFDSQQPLSWCLQKTIHINSYASFLSGARELNSLLTMFIVRGMVFSLHALPYNYWHWISCAVSLISLQICSTNSRSEHSEKIFWFIICITVTHFIIHLFLSYPFCLKWRSHKPKSRW